MPLSVPLNVTENEITLADVTTNDVSTTKHGFVPKAPNDATKFLDGTGAWTAPAGGSSSVFIFPGGAVLTGISYPKIFNSSVSIGDTDLYTVPAGKRLAIFAMSVYNNSGVGTISFLPQIKINSVYFRLRSTSFNVGDQLTGTHIGTGYIAEAGETVAINTTTNNGAVVSVIALEFDNTNPVYTSKRVDDFSVGDNVVLTVPANKQVYILQTSLEPSNPGTLFYQNKTGSNRTIQWKYTPSGGSTVAIAQSLSVASFATFTHCFAMEAGDTLSINVDSNAISQMAWCTVIEVDV